MRRLALLITMTGCNWVFGLKQTVQLDAPADAQAIHTNLAWAVITTDGNPPMMGIDPLVTYAGIGSETARPNVPLIQVGDFTSLDELAYNASDEGSFEIPYKFRTAPHRIVYTLPGESFAHEFQWAVAGAYLTVPRTTRLDVAPVPADSGYTIMPIGLGFDPQFPAIATSGSFTFSNALGDFEHSTGTFTYRYASKAKAMAGPLGAPQMAHGDWVLVMNWFGRSGTQQSVAGWALTQVDLAAGQLTTPATQPTWQSGDVTYSNICTGDPSKCMPSFNAGATKARVEGALGSRKVTSVDSMMYGVSPSLGLPGFVPGGPPSYLDVPLIIPFVQSASQDSSMVVCDPTGALPFARVMYSGITNSRIVNGVTLTSALQAVSNVFTGPMPYPAPLVTTFDLEGISLAGDNDDVVVPVSSSMRELRLMTEAGQTADDFVVTVYEITNSTLAPVRVYHVLVGSVMIDGNLLASGHSYVLGVTTRHGFPGAFRGDYREVAYPFGIATTFSRTFKIQ